MSLFWFHAGLAVAMIALDVICWVVVARLTKRRLWRTLAGIFLGLQLIAHLTAVSGVDWSNHVPQIVLLAVIIWHYFGVAALSTIGAIFVGRWVLRKLFGLRRGKRNSSEIVPVSAPSLSRRDFMGAAAALAPPIFTAAFTGLALAQLNDFRVRRFVISLPALPRALDGLTIAHVTDVHVGRLTCGRVLRQMVDTTNALKADLALVTGDLIDYDLADLPEALSLIRAMEGRHGLYMIEGNHDLFENGAEFERRVKASGVPLLLDESAVADVRGHPVQLFGLRWMAGMPQERDRVTALQLHELMKLRQPDAFPILMSHHPHALDAASKYDLPLTLAGHTHGGQMMLDGQHGVGSVLFRYWSGLYSRGNSRMIVSNGVGNMFPIRINAPAEIVHLTLRSGKIPA